MYLITQKLNFFSKLRETGVAVSFGEKLKLVFNKVSFPFNFENGLFVWKIFPCSIENCFNIDILQIWHAKKLTNFLDGTVEYREFIPTLRGRPSQEQIDAADRKGKEIFDEKQMAIWYELFQCLDKKSVLFLQPYWGKGSDAWSVLCQRFKSFERPRLQKLISNLTSLRKYNNESIVDYITRAELNRVEAFRVEPFHAVKPFRSR